MDRYYVDNQGYLCTGDHPILFGNQILVDALDPGLVKLVYQGATPQGLAGRPDIIFSADRDVVWVECKTNLNDWENSLNSKRLAQELRQAQEYGATVRVVAYPDVQLFHDEDLVRLQCMGVLVVPFSDNLKYWRRLREILATPGNQRRVLAGTHHRKPASALRGLPGVGPKTEARLLARFGTANKALASYPHGWGEVLGFKTFERLQQRLDEAV